MASTSISFQEECIYATKLCIYQAVSRDEHYYCAATCQKNQIALLYFLSIIYWKNSRKKKQSSQYIFQLENPACPMLLLQHPRNTGDNIIQKKVQGADGTAEGHSTIQPNTGQQGNIGTNPKHQQQNNAYYCNDQVLLIKLPNLNLKQHHRPDHIMDTHRNRRDLEEEGTATPCIPPALLVHPTNRMDSVSAQNNVHHN
jgi:hypothetical protein